MLGYARLSSVMRNYGEQMSARSNAEEEQRVDASVIKCTIILYHQ
jgi:hypothetical protein